MRAVSLSLATACTGVACDDLEAGHSQDSLRDRIGICQPVEVSPGAHGRTKLTPCGVESYGARAAEKKPQQQGLARFRLRMPSEQ